jgi:hypothetical protein
MAAMDAGEEHEMNAPLIDAEGSNIDEGLLFQRASSGDLDACAALLDEVAPDIYGELLLETRDAGTAERLTYSALLAMAKPLRNGEIANARELRWRFSSLARTELVAMTERRKGLTGVRASIRHLFGLVSASGLAAYATVVAI